ncbi:MAG: LysR family transcriptional regulator [Verrucomicrobia bacterium]|nr:LysR family transcriptional regulator [Verrucomicrobiota bacterium]
MELRQLRSLLVLAEELHFGRAADRLGIAQPALSRQIQQLETELQSPLFIRSPRAVALTDMGREFVASISPAIQQLESAAANSVAFAQASRGRLRIGVCNNLSYRFAPALLERLHQDAPGLRIDVRELSTAEQVRTLHSSEIDIGLAILPITDPSLIMRRIFREPLVAVVNAKSRFARRAFIRLGELAHEEFIVCPRYRQSGFHELTMELAGKAGFRLRVAREIDAKETALALIERGLGISLAPESASVLGNDRLRYIPIGDPEIVIEIGIVWRRENMSSLIRRFIDSAVQLALQTEAERSAKLVA